MRAPARRSLSVIGLLALSAVAACASNSDDATPTPTGVASREPSAAATSLAPASPSSSDAGGEGEEVSVFDLQVGDCILAAGERAESVTVVGCDQPHLYEAFAVLEHGAADDEPYPGDDEIRAHADTECRAPFESFVGFGYRSSIWYITSVTPSEETWAQGDREIVCALNQQEGDEPIEVKGSAEGSGE